MMTIYRLLDTLRFYAETRLRDDEGAVTIEYGVVTAVIALGLVAVGTALVLAITGWFADIGATVTGLPDGS